MADPNGIDGLGAVGGAPASPPVTRPVQQGGGASFGAVLAGKLETAPLKFSGHALQRVEQRGINLDPTTMSRLTGGVDRAAAKGCRNSLVLVDQNAFVVSVPNRTVITAVDRDHMKEQVFTNIDSALIA
ncbi:MAG TPA: TIGR02530 family flagellar biosynthesis protein [Gaiellaceae bacterium]|nr:TIGR02530 family flagellar biosynthesis protein [Gaiellaceae bacterium]